MTRTQYTKGVGDWQDENEYGSINKHYYRESPSKKYGFVTEVKTRKSRNATVNTVRMEINGYGVTINRYDGNDKKLQVFIDAPNGGSTVSYISLDELDKHIKNNTTG